MEHNLKRPLDAPPLYSQDGKGLEAEVFAHYFVGGADWFVTEYDPHEDVAFGWACLGDRQNAELGYVSIGELESVEVPVTITVTRDRVPDGAGTVGLRVEYDEHWTRVPLREAIAELDKRAGRA